MNQQYLQNQKNSKRLVQSITLSLVITLCTLTCQAQYKAKKRNYNIRKNKIEIGMAYSRFTTGSEVKQFHVPSLILQKENYRAFISPAFGKLDKKLSGGNIEFQYVPQLINSSLGVFVHISSLINHSIKMNYSREMLMHDYPTEILFNKKVTAVESYAGFGIEKNILNRFALQSSIGAGYYIIHLKNSMKMGAPSMMVKITLIHLKQNQKYSRYKNNKYHR